jgi:hypothetical protein
VEGNVHFEFYDITELGQERENPATFRRASMVVAPRVGEQVSYWVSFSRRDFPESVALFEEGEPRKVEGTVKAVKHFFGRSFLQDGREVQLHRVCYYLCDYVEKSPSYYDEKRQQKMNRAGK